jgi:hypothetical protein
MVKRKHHHRQNHQQRNHADQPKHHHRLLSVQTALLNRRPLTPRSPPPHLQPHFAWCCHPLPPFASGSAQSRWRLDSHRSVGERMKIVALGESDGFELWNGGRGGGWGGAVRSVGCELGMGDGMRGERWVMGGGWVRGAVCGGVGGG